MQIIIIQWAFPLFPNSRHFKTNHHFPRGLPLITLAVDIFSRVFIFKGFSLYSPRRRRFKANHHFYQGVFRLLT